MRTNINSLLLVFLSPLVSTMSPMIGSLIILSLLVFINLITDIISNFKECTETTRWRRFRCIFLKRSTWIKTFRKIYEYMFAILTVGLFEIYILGTQHIELMGGMVSLTKASIIIAGYLEVDDIFKNIEKITGSNIFARLKNVIPEKVKSLVSRKSND